MGQSGLLVLNRFGLFRQIGLSHRGGILLCHKNESKMRMSVYHLYDCFVFSRIIKKGVFGGNHACNKMIFI